MTEKSKPTMGDMCWWYGGAWDYPQRIVVTEKNIKIVLEFWNRLYFEDYETAYRACLQAHAAYGRWQME